ncbi:unnamed protein product [Bemisia tabaci]|uniref:Uncharacterized protein n=1 Tax=Bemisia tabaci TaxID=7038 RepID=A0A9P0A2I9_BEMTA|nr:unnamed protein product [Bemisia tabaci]
MSETNRLALLLWRKPELGPRAYGIASRRTPVSGVLDKTASKSDLIGAPEHCDSTLPSRQAWQFAAELRARTQQGSKTRWASPRNRRPSKTSSRRATSLCPSPTSTEPHPHRQRPSQQHLQSPRCYPARTPSTGTPFASATTMDSVMQGIRDLKLTIAEMEDKLDRVVQKVAPGPGGKSLMNKGADLFRKFLRLSTPEEENEEPVRLERAMNSMQTRGPRGVGLSYH